MVPSLSPCVGQRLGSYRIVASLPRAGVADRWRAMHTTLHSEHILITVPFETDLVEIMETFPMTTTEKIQKFRIKDMMEEKHGSQGS